MLPRVRVVAVLLTALAALAVPSIAPSTASATPSGSSASTASGGDVVLYGECRHYPISYTSSAPPLSSVYRLHIEVVDPNGRRSEGFVANSANPDTPSPASGTFSYQFCGSEPVGTWTVATTGYTVTVPGVESAIPENDTTFTVRHAQTAVTLARKALPHGRWRISTDVRVESPNGYVAANGADVQLQRLVNGQWKHVQRTVLTTVRGHAAAQVALPRRSKLRAVVRGAGYYDGSTSDVVTLKRR